MKRIIWRDDLESFVEFENQNKKVLAKIISSTPKKLVSKILKNPTEKQIQNSKPSNANYYSIGRLESIGKYLIQYYEPNN